MKHPCTKFRAGMHFSRRVWSIRFVLYTRESSYCFSSSYHRNSVCPSVRRSVYLSVRHTGGSAKNGASKNHQSFTVGCL